MHRIFSAIRQSFFLPKQTQRSRSVLQDRSRSLGLFRKGKIGIIAKFHRTNLVIRSHSRGTKTLSYSLIISQNDIHYQVAASPCFMKFVMTDLHVLPVIFWNSHITNSLSSSVSVDT